MVLTNLPDSASVANETAQNVREGAFSQEPTRILGSLRLKVSLIESVERRSPWTILKLGLVLSVIALTVSPSLPAQDRSNIPAAPATPTLPLPGGTNSREYAFAQYRGG